MRINLHISSYDPKSAGVRGLYFLMESIAALGVRTTINAATDDDCVDIIPDQQGENSFDAKRIVRFFGYYPAEWYGKAKLPASEMVLVYSAEFIGEVQALCPYPLSAPFAFPLIEPGLFFPEEKTIPALVYTPGYKSRECQWRPAGMPAISRHSHSREDAVAMLRRTKDFYSTDDFTAMLIEALMCGCNVFIVRDVNQFEPYHNPDAHKLLMTPENGRAAALDLLTRCQDFFGVDFQIQDK